MEDEDAQMAAMRAQFEEMTAKLREDLTEKLRAQEVATKEVTAKLRVQEAANKTMREEREEAAKREATTMGTGTVARQGPGGQGAVSYLLPAVAMVCLYSYLPHKELRFIFPALPLFNLVAGVGASRAARGILLGGGGGGGGDEDDGDVGGGKSAESESKRTICKKKERHILVRLVLFGLVFGSVVVTALTTFLATTVSRENYPGGTALEALHRVIDADHRAGKHKGGTMVHVDAEAAMSGVSRFGQRKEGVTYSKQETGVTFSEFNYIITGNTSQHRLLDLFEVREAIEGYDGVTVRPFWAPDSDGGAIVSVSRSSKMFVMARRFANGAYVMARMFQAPNREDLA